MYTHFISIFKKLKKSFYDGDKIQVVFSEKVLSAVFDKMFEKGLEDLMVLGVGMDIEMPVWHW